MKNILNDKTGNLIEDKSEQLKIHWTYYNKLKQIDSANSTKLKFRYDAFGNRIVKDIVNKSKEIYVRDAQGNAIVLYEIKNDSLLSKEYYIYGTNKLGYMEDKAYMGKRMSGKNVGGVGVIPAQIFPNLPNPFVFAGTTSVVPVYFGKKRYELSDWLGNVRVVLNDRKTPINTGSVTVSYWPQVVSVTDYYSFGSSISERSYEVVKPQYRFGFNNVEKISDLNENFYEFKFRNYDARLGRFWSVDPLFGKYPWNSPYVFAENRVIDGVDLEGREYLRADESRIEIKGGRVHLKITNFLTINQNAFKAANNDPKNWRPGEIGINTSIGYIKSDYSFLNNHLLKGDINTEYPNKAPSVSPTYDDANPNTQAPGGTRGVATIVGVVNFINFVLEQYAVWTAWYDINKINKHQKILRTRVIEDINIAIRSGLIPEKYQNTMDLGNIMNVVLQGVNNTKNKDIYKIGMKIWNTISNPSSVNISPLIDYPPKEVAPADNTRVVKPRTE